MLLSETLAHAALKRLAVASAQQRSFRIVAEEGVAHLHELPAGWGLLLRKDDHLEIVAPAIWQEIPEHHAFQLLIRIAISGTRAIDRALNVELPQGRWSEGKAPGQGARCAADSPAANGRLPEPP